MLQPSMMNSAATNPAATNLPRETGFVRFAVDAWELEAAQRIRREVFVGEQRLFESHDRDAIDFNALTIIAVDDREVIGTVRTHREAWSGVWWGSRLAVSGDRRGSARVAVSLIRKAVASARAAGCERFLAHIQPQNRRLFERVGWRVLQPTMHEGRPHLLVEADLPRFAPERWLTDLEVRWARRLDKQTRSRRWSGAAVHPISGDPLPVNPAPTAPEPMATAEIVEAFVGAF